MSRMSLYNGLKKFKQSYIGVKPKEEDLKKFTRLIIEYYKEVSQNRQQSEEYLKNETNDFLKANFYSDKPYKVNVINKIDSAILKDGKVQVIFEYKKPENINEMIKIDNINKKALHEAVLYYFEERLKKNNDELKYIVITDTINWFVFNSKEIEKIFYDKLSSKYKKFIAGQLVSTNNETFYKIIADYLSNEQVELNYIYFNLDESLKKVIDKDVNEILANIKTYKEILYLYKLIHPDFLLKEYSPQDINVLNKGFYDELLYLMGLKEVKEKSKILIVRNEEEQGSLLNNVYKKLVADKDLSEDDETESIALELVITWINRILFIKLFESQLILFNKDSKGSTQYEILNSDRLKRFSDFKILFFEILNKKIDNREPDYKHFDFIPYLNSSLFELSDYEKQYFTIAEVENTNLRLKERSNLKAWEKYKGIKEQKLLEYLLDFLKSYDFSSHLEHADLKVDNRDIINASVLGLIFEKINGYKDGSVYTPSCITEYMCKGSIEKAVVNKYNEKYFTECNTIKDIRYDLRQNRPQINKQQEISGLINSLRICDPAVGSGHFLVSALNQLLVIKFYLNAMFKHKTNEFLTEWECNIQVENDTLIITDNKGDLLHYDRHNSLSQIIQETIFNEKKELIENCLFGVDINPKSVYLCRLRLWIELLKHAYYKVDGTMETLPNIDINIKTGNSLINRLEFEVGKNKLKPSKLKEVKDEKQILQSIKDYKNAVKDYKNTSDKEEKRKIKKNIENRKSEITVNMGQGKLFGNVNPEIFKNSMEWAIEFPEVLDEKGTFLGFDIVIANPPYGIINKKQNIKEAIIVPTSIFDYYKKSFEYKPATSGAMNIFKLFIVKSFSLLKKNGIFSEIFPLAFIADSNAKKLREYVLANNSVFNIEAFPERDNENKRVFESAKISVCILNAQKNKNSKDFFIRVNSDKYIDFNENKVYLNLKTIKLFDAKYLTIPLLAEADLNFLTKIFKKSEKIETFAHCYTGEIDLSLNKDLLTTNPCDAEMIKGAIIDKYVKRKKMSQGEILYLNSAKYLDNNTSEKATHYKKERIVMQGITGVNEKIRLKMTYLPSNIFCANSVNYIIFDRHEIKPKYVLAVLNSKLLNYIFKKFSTNSNVNGYEVDALPVKFSDDNTQNKLIEVVDKILGLTQNEAYFENKVNQELVKEQEKIIDQLVYKIYNLTQEEIDMVEGQ